MENGKLKSIFNFCFWAKTLRTPSDKSTPGGAGGGNASSCSSVPRSLGVTFRALRSRGMVGVFSVVVSLSLWQAARYWTFHARERIFDFASQRLTYRYPDFLERFRQVNA